jgi:hypothetical protein
MTIGSIGSSSSFWQQDQTYWSQASSQDATIAATDNIISAIQSAETKLGKGLASIANGEALQRVNSQLVAGIQSLLKGSSSSSSNARTASTSSITGAPGSFNTKTSGAPATGIGRTALTTGTPLSSLGILPGGTITISAGLSATTYTSTGTDTVGNLIDAINIDLPTNAQVTASLNSSGKLVITSRNKKDSIAIVGSGTDATDIGFGSGNSAFQPTKPSTTTAASPTSSSTSGPASFSSSATSSSSNGSNTLSGTSSSPNASQTLPSLLALTEQNLNTAADILGGSGVAGNLVNMLA